VSPKRRPVAAPPKAQPFHAPFLGLGALREALPAGAARPAPAKVPAAPARAVVRLERKGRRGKEVTVVEQLALPRAERQAWLADLRRVLGCGGAEEDEALVLQGDHRKRVEAYLLAKGVARVSLG
jgi:translation initiation factor 1